MKVRTVLGDVPPSALGRTLCHEHLLVHYRKSPRLESVFFRMFRRAVYPMLEAMKRGGGNAFVEATPIMPTRYPALWQEVSRRSGIHIIASTGAYVERHIPPSFRKMGADEIAGVMSSEVRKGMDGTNIRAGIIKLASGGLGAIRTPHGVKPGFGPTEGKFFRAAIVVHRELGVPITTHAYPGLACQVQFFAKNRVDLAGVSVGHLEVCTWFDIIEAARSGIGLAFTNLGGEDDIPEDVEVQQIAWLARHGYRDQITLSTDQALMVDEKRRRLSRHFPVGYDHVYRVTVPKLMAAGLKARDVDRMLIDNPRRYLAF